MQSAYEWLFSPQELEADHAYMKKQYDKIRDLRKQFAAKLAEDTITPSISKNYFKQVDQAIAGIKEHFQERVIEKTDAMTVLERRQFAKKPVAE